MSAAKCENKTSSYFSIPLMQTVWVALCVFLQALETKSLWHLKSVKKSVALQKQEALGHRGVASCIDLNYSCLGVLCPRLTDGLRAEGELHKSTWNVAVTPVLTR